MLPAPEVQNGLAHVCQCAILQAKRFLQAAASYGLPEHVTHVHKHNVNKQQRKLIFLTMMYLFSTYIPSLTIDPVRMCDSVMISVQEVSRLVFTLFSWFPLCHSTAQIGQ